MTFKRLAIFGVLALVLFFLYYVLPRALFVFVAILVVGGFVVCSFVKIRGQTIYEIIVNSFKFFLSPRTYIWQKKAGMAPIQLKTGKKEETKEKKEAPLKVAPKSRLGSLRFKLDLGSKQEE